jgi:K+-transporting ATPase c subunit
MLFALTVVCGVVYPLGTLVGQTVAPDQANGSTVAAAGGTVGPLLIGQAFTGGQWSKAVGLHRNRSTGETSTQINNRW